uniref:Recombination endonuclease VII n=1 Tax=Caulobacter phage BL57 TaxID=3348355 RepID=A0AB74UKY8_9VIRU
MSEMKLDHLTPEQRLEHRRAQKRASYRRNRAHHVRRVGKRNKAQILAKNEEACGYARPELCEACGEKDSKGVALALDHDHLTGKIRGWLCRRCNLLLGSVNDDARLLRLLADYLDDPGYMPSQHTSFGN